MKKNEMKKALIEKLGTEEFEKDFNRYISFGWTQKETLEYMIEFNFTKRTMAEVMFAIK